VKGTMSGTCRQWRLHTAWKDNIKMWTGLPVEKSIRPTKNCSNFIEKDEWRNGESPSMMWPTLGSIMAKKTGRYKQENKVTVAAPKVSLNIGKLFYQ